VRELNHLTLDGVLEYPADVYEAVANLKLATMRLPQLLGQLGNWLVTESCWTPRAGPSPA
jgi:hypothetical protein